MFTGLIQEVGVIRKTIRRGGYRRLEVSFNYALGPLRPGDSMAVNGVCLTASEVDHGVFSCDLSGETQNRATLGEARAGELVNLERPVKAADPLGGHIVLGHADGMGRILRLRPTSGGLEIFTQAPPEIMGFLVPKGSIAVDGVSLTIGALEGSGFWVFLIPETQRRTTLGEKRVGQRVNIEIDYLAKLVKKFLEDRGKDRVGIFQGARGED